MRIKASSIWKYLVGMIRTVRQQRQVAALLEVSVVSH